jgi:hypothetical protein
MNDTLRCRHCGEVIGAYEALVAFSHGRAHLGSRLTLPSREDSEAAYFHRGCFVERHGESEFGE